MFIHMEHQGPATSLEEIADFESKIELVLPDEYKAFLLKYNGGQPTPDSYAMWGKDTISEVVHFFYGFRMKYECFNLIDNICCYDERMPFELIPIACDPFDNQICISTKPSEYGWIWFWDHEGEVLTGEEPDYRNCTKVAESINELLEKLVESPNED